MADIARLHRQALDATRSIVAKVEPVQWATPSPCEGWDVHALVNHVVSGNLWAAELAAGRTIEEVGDFKSIAEAWDWIARESREWLATRGGA